jgi:hypothetical protein
VEEVTRVQERHVGCSNTVDAQDPCVWLVPLVPIPRVEACCIPTAKVRSVGEVHAIEGAGLALALGVRDGECRRVGPDAVKETILEAEQMKSVSMPSELFLDAGVDVDRIAGRAGSVNERRPWVEACGACSCSGVFFEEAGTDMMRTSCKHCRAGDEVFFLEEHQQRRRLVCQRGGGKAARVSAPGTRGWVGERLEMPCRRGAWQDFRFQTDQRISLSHAPNVAWCAGRIAACRARPYPRPRIQSVFVLCVFGRNKQCAGSGCRLAHACGLTRPSVCGTSLCITCPASSQQDG